MKPAFKLLLLLMLIAFYSKAQYPTYYLNPDKKLTQYNFDSWTTDDGLPTNSLLYIHQSEQGYLWISGYSGLLRFDGVDFKVFNNANTPQFNSNVVRNIAEDSEGNLWLSTQGNGLVRYSNGEFNTVVDSQSIMHLYRGLLVDNQDRVWGASPDHGWFYYNEGKFHFIDYSSSLKHIEVRAIAQSKSGAIWFATLGEGIFRYQNGNLKNFNIDDGLINNWVYSLYADENDNLWIGTSNGLCYFDGYQFYPELPGISTTVNRILKDRFGNLWVGTFEGLFRKQAYSGEVESITAQNGLSNNFIVDMVFDAEGSLWITHYKGGITRIKDGKFTNYTQKGGLPGRVVNTVFETSRSELLVGFDNGKLVRINDGDIVPLPLKTDLSGTRIRHVLVDRRQNLWVSTYAGLLYVGKDGTEQMFNEPTGFLGTKIRLTFQDSRGNIWVGTRNNGVIIIRPDFSFQKIDVGNGLSSNLVMAIEEDREGNVWIGTSEGIGGLNRISPDGAIDLVTSQQGFTSDIVFNLYHDKQGQMWIASVDGVWLYHDGDYSKITARQGLLDNSVFDIVEDDLGYFWMPFSQGIMRVKKSEMLAVVNGSAQQVNCRLYNQFDGMPSAECNPTAQALKGSGGHLYFPTLDGLSMINPNDEILNNFIPPVVVEEVVVDGQTFNAQTPMVFEPGFRRFTFNFTGLSLYEPEKIQFQYQLEGFEEEWHFTGARSVSYTNLPHGEYLFKVKASNNDGVWNDTGAGLSLTINPRFTESTIFYILILVFSSSLILFMYLWRINRFRKTQFELEAKVRQRTSEVLEKNKVLETQKEEIERKNAILQQQNNEIEAQAHELIKQQSELRESIASKDKIFSIISHDLRSPLGNMRSMLDLLIDKSDQFDIGKRKRILENLAEITKSTYYLLDNLLSWSRSKRGLIAFKPQMFLVAPLINEIVQLTKYQAEKKNITVVSKVDESDLVFGDVNMIQTIFRNLLANAIKFTHEGGTVEISAQPDGDYSVFHFKDNGVGMSAESVRQLMFDGEIQATFGTNREKGSGLGLLLSKDFIAKNGGSFKVKSEPGKGSVFMVALKRYQV